VVGCIYAHYDLTQRLDDQARAFAAGFHVT